MHPTHFELIVRIVKTFVILCILIYAFKLGRGVHRYWGTF